jgi:amidophosphoribosyltransferase
MSCSPYVSIALPSTVFSSHPHIYGIELAISQDLIAHDRDRRAIAGSNGADDVVFLSLEDLEAACAELTPRANQRFESASFAAVR